MRQRRKNINDINESVSRNNKYLGIDRCWCLLHERLSLEKKRENVCSFSPSNEFLVLIFIIFLHMYGHFFSYTDHALLLIIVLHKHYPFSLYLSYLSRQPIDSVQMTLLPGRAIRDPYATELVGATCCEK